MPPSGVRPRGQFELRLFARSAAALGFFVLSATPVSINSAITLAETTPVDQFTTGAVAAEAVIVPRIADAIPEPTPVSPADRAFLFATGNVAQEQSAAPQVAMAMDMALAARPPVVPIVVAEEAIEAADAVDEAFDPEAPIAYAEPGGVEDVEAPFRALINPMARPDTAVNWPDPTTDHDWVANPIPDSARTASQIQCMAEAIYFEARSEPVRGQLAVAQVVVNRLKNPTYPGTVCGVVYQNQHMRNACQFSFACDGIREVVRDRDSWIIAEGIARAVLNGEAIWLEEVGASTHYHATYVRPAWARQMQQMAHIGLHVFYRTYGGGWI